MDAGAFTGRRTGRAIFGIALVYLLVLKALFAPFALGSAAFGSVFPDAVIYGAHESGAPATDGDQRPMENACCDDGCLLRLLTYVAPALFALAIAFRIERSPFRMRIRPARRSAGPPWRIAAHPNAQRAPPLAFI